MKRRGPLRKLSRSWIDMGRRLASWQAPPISYLNLSVVSAPALRF